MLVNGGAQAGTSLIVDGLTDVPQIGDTFTIAGVAKTYIITALPTVVSGGTTLAISPALDSSPADNAVITFRSTLFSVGTRTRFDRYRIGSTEKIVGVNGVSFPFIYDNTTFTRLNAVADLQAAEHVAWFKNSLFFAKGDAVYFSAPFSDTDYTAALGGGVINVGGKITGLKVFREQLIVFCEQSIKRIVGNSSADYVLQPITENIGCVDGDTIQEIGGDVMFLGPDGLRLLSATDRIGDFGLDPVAKAIQNELTALIAASTSFSSVVIREKSQYRLLGYKDTVTVDAAVGILGTQMIEGGIAWAELRGFKAYSSSSDYNNKRELVVFAGNTGYVYEMENGNSFDGANIKSTFHTPFFPISDPRLRKTFYKLHTYFDPQGSVDIVVSLRLDFNNKDIIQPSSYSLSNTAGTGSFFGSGVFGVSTFGGSLQTIFETSTIGSGFAVSIQYESDSTNPPYTFDAATIEYATHDRR